MSAHLREIQLRQLLAGEKLEEAAAHLAACAECKARTKDLEAEQQRFETAIPFERFAAGVERATRQPRQTPRSNRRPMQIIVAIAASVLVLAGVPLVMRGGGDHGSNRTKGGSEVEIVVAGASNGPQRMGSHDPLAPEALAPGERVRIGYRAGGYRYLAAVTIDEKGEVSALYPERGPSLRIRTDAATEYMPALEFTGAGLERVVVVMTEEPIDIEEVKKAAKVRYDEARGNLAQLGTLDLPGEQFHRTFLKPAPSGTERP